MDLDAWQKLLGDSAFGSPLAAAPAAAPAPLNRSAAYAAMSYLPTTMAIRARELTVEGRRLHNVVVGGSREGLTCRGSRKRRSPAARRRWRRC